MATTAAFSAGDEDSEGLGIFHGDSGSSGGGG